MNIYRLAFLILLALAVSDVSAREKHHANTTPGSTVDSSNINTADFFAEGGKAEALAKGGAASVGNTSAEGGMAEGGTVGDISIGGDRYERQAPAVTVFGVPPTAEDMWCFSLGGSNSKGAAAGLFCVMQEDILAMKQYEELVAMGLTDQAIHIRCTRPLLRAPFSVKNEGSWWLTRIFTRKAVRANTANCDAVLTQHHYSLNLGLKSDLEDAQYQLAYMEHKHAKSISATNERVLGLERGLSKERQDKADLARQVSELEKRKPAVDNSAYERIQSEVIQLRQEQSTYEPVIIDTFEPRRQELRKIPRIPGAKDE